MRASLILLAACILVGCSSTYYVSSVDRRESDQNILSRYTLNVCVSEILLNWSEEIPLGWQPSRTYSGETIHYIQVDYRSLMGDAADYIVRYSDNKCPEQESVTIKLNSFVFKHYASTDTGYVAILADIKAGATAKCSRSGDAKVKFYHSESPTIETGFFPDSASIQQAVVSASTFSAIDILTQIINECAVPK